MQIWVDAEACPRVIKDILYRAAGRLHVPLTLVANKALSAPSSPSIRVFRNAFANQLDRFLARHAQG